MTETLAATTSDLLARMLRRLPPSLWDTSPASPTVQRDLYQALAEQCTLWLEQREIARTMTLLLEAQGVDLDVLLQDYGLRRYLQRPDAYARQVGEQILFAPQGTLYSLAQLADLLFYDQPHQTRRTGRSHVHVLLAYTRPITVPYSYWGLVSTEGLWYAVTVDGAVATIAPAPPPGLDLSPGPQTLHWFQVLDETGAPWYVTITADTLHVSQSQPAGTGTAEPFSVLDGHDQRWTLSVSSRDAALVTTLVDVATMTAWYWRLFFPTGATAYVWIEGQVPTINTVAPGGFVDQTPGGGAPLTWVAVPDETGVLWYIVIQDDTLFVQATLPAGFGTAEPWTLLDAAGTLWRLTVHSLEQAVVATAIRSPTEGLEVLSPHHVRESFALADSAGALWWFAVSGSTLLGTPSRPMGAADVTPTGGPYRWLRVTDLAGALWYAFPSTAGVLQVSLTNPGGLGTATPRSLGDQSGVQWHWGVVSNALVLSNAPPVDYGGLTTTICLNDAAGTRWFWRVDDGRLDWSPVLWPDAADQSPWGEIGWLQVTSTTGVPLYVFPDLEGIPTAAAAPPMSSPWGWQEPVTFVDAAGARWTLQVTPIVPGPVDYWQVRTETGAVARLFIEARVPTLRATAPAGGVDQTPGGVPLEWWTATNAQGARVPVVPVADTLRTLPAPPTSVGTPRAFQGQDAAGTVWRLQAATDRETLRTVVLGDTWLVGVTALADAAVPALPPLLSLRDAVDAFGHIQAAGSLVTTLIT
jgi:catechol 2,3-dioxygenase-like lactoylglutathione lyase family enzyme